MRRRMKEVLRGFYLNIYLFGWGNGPINRPAPRCLRRIFAGTEMHRAWLLGYMGLHAGGGVCDRNSYHYRHRDVRRGAPVFIQAQD